MTSEFDRDDMSDVSALNVNTLSPRVLNSVPRRKTHLDNDKPNIIEESLDKLDLTKGRSEIKNK